MDTQAKPTPTDDLDALGSLLAASRTRAIEARAAAGIDQRWAADLDAYEGRDLISRLGDQLMDQIRIQGEAAAFAPQNDAQPRATVYVHLSRQKTNAWVARIQKLLFPHDSRNWEYAPTPVPELHEAVKAAANAPYIDPQTGQQLQHPNEQRPLTLGDVATDHMASVRRAAANMQREVDDQLTECGYATEARKVIADAGKVGVGILKGPIPRVSQSKRWKLVQDAAAGETYQLEQGERIAPASARVHFWDFFPDPDCGDDIHKGTHVWERDRVSGRKLLDLAKLPGYLPHQVMRAFKEGPQAPLPDASSYRRYGPNGRFIEWDSKQFEIWSYTGDLTREELIAAGVSVPPEALVVSACVVMCNNHVIKAMLNPHEDGSLPYDVFCWEPLDGTWAGVGIPYLMASEQKTFVTAWRAMLDNAALCHAPMLVIKDIIQPADKTWKLYAKKVFIAPKDAGDVRDAITTIDIPNHQAELQNIINLALKFADDGTAMPQIAQGERGTAPDTVGGMTLLMQSANAVTERVVRLYDDQITKRHLTRYYQFNMAYNPKPDIKGDMQVVARGITHLLLRDAQQQGLIALLQIADKPEYARFADKEKLWKAVCRGYHLDPEDVSKSDDQIAKENAQPPAPPPEAPAVTAAKIRADSAKQVAEIRAQGEANAQKLEADSEALNAKMRIAQDQQEEMFRREQAEREHELALMTFMQQNNLSLDQMKFTMAQLLIKNAHDAKQSERTRQPEPAEA